MNQRVASSLRRFAAFKRTSSTSTSTTAAPAEVNRMHGSHHWQFERWLSVGLLPAVGIPLFLTGPSRTCDFLLGFLLPLHCHLGFGQIVTDYLNKRKVGGLVNRVLVGGLYGLTALSMWGLYRFNTNDVGITEFVRNCWKSKSVVAAKESSK